MMNIIKISDALYEEEACAHAMELNQHGSPCNVVIDTKFFEKHKQFLTPQDQKVSRHEFCRGVCMLM